MKTKLFPIAIALFFVSASLQAQILPGNFWLNSTFEAGVNPGLTTGTPDNWNRGGADGTILLWSMANSLSPTHSLAVDKPIAGPYGEWYSDVSIVGLAAFGDMVTMRWNEMYSINPGNEMRLTVRFLDGGGNGPDNHFVVNGNSAGWAGSAAASTFSVRNQQLLVNQPGAVTMRIQLVSGGGDPTFGNYLIDDLSVAVVPEPSTIALLSVGGLVGISELLRRRKIAR